MKLDDMARSINRYLISVANTFGVQSTEYQHAEKLVYQKVLHNNRSLERRTDDGVIQIKRGKALKQASINPHLQYNLGDLRTTQKKPKNTTKKMKQKYVDEFKKNTKKTPTKNEIKSMAENEYIVRNNSDSFYEENKVTIRENAELYDMWREAGKFATWTAGEINPFYEQAVAATEAFIAEDTERYEDIKKQREATIVDLSEFGG